MSDRLTSINAIKGLAIIFVLLLHSLSPEYLERIYSTVHIGQAVPIFIAVTFFLSYLKLDKCMGSISSWYTKRNFIKLFHKVIFPYVLVLMLQCLILIAIGQLNVKHLVASGGYGPGSYYIWIYVQIWLLAPILYKVLNCNFIYSSALILLVCIILNILCSYICPNFLWRLLSFRYIFLSVISYIWIRGLAKFNFNRFLLVLLAALSLFYLVSNKVNFSPFVYVKSWTSQNYPVYFWTFVLINLLTGLINHLPFKLVRILCWLGQNSWQIFLSQMFVISFVSELPISNPALSSIAYIVFVFTSSIGSVLFLKHLLTYTKSFILRVHE